MDKMVISDNLEFSVTSMFAGCGGFDLGFSGGFEYRGHQIQKTSFRLSHAYEIDEHCETTYRMNIQSAFTRCDLASYPPHKLQQSDVLIGGFPCQDFSNCGPRKGLESERGQLYKAMVGYCQTHKPKLFIAENVSNIVTIGKGSVLKTIITDFEAVGYRIEVWNLHAPDYGIPQARNRVFLIGVRDDLPGSPVPPEKKFINHHRSIEWAISDLETVYDESVANQSQYFKANKAKNGHGQGDEISQADKPGYTVRANAKSRVHFHYRLLRRLTIRECARLQTFPDDFVFPHSATTNIMQIGNAVPPLLAYSVALSCERYLQSIYSMTDKAA